MAPAENDGELPAPLDVAGPTADAVEPDVPDPLGCGAEEERIPDGPKTIPPEEDCPELVTPEKTDEIEEPKDPGKAVTLAIEGCVVLAATLVETIPDGPKTIPVPLIAVVSGAEAEEAGAAEEVSGIALKGRPPLDPAACDTAEAADATADRLGSITLGGTPPLDPAACDTAEAADATADRLGSITLGGTPPLDPAACDITEATDKLGNTTPEGTPPLDPAACDTAEAADATADRLGSTTVG